MATLIEEQDVMTAWRAQVKAKRDARPWARYRLRPVAANGQPTGRHEQKDRDGIVRSYPAGSIVESQEDLAERWPDKFEIIREDVPRRPEDVAVPAGYKLVKVDAPAVTGAATPSAPVKDDLAKPKAGSLHSKESLTALDLPSLLLIASDEEVVVKGFEKDKQRVINAILGK